MKKHPRPLLILLALVIGFPAYAGMSGPPGSSGKEGQWGVGAGYFRAASRFKADAGTAAITQNQKYAEFTFPAVCFSEDGESFVRLGMADFDDGEGFKSDDKLFGTVGMRDVWYRSGGRKKSTLRVGTVVQLSYFAEAKATSGSQTGSAKSLWRASVAVPVRWEAMDKVSVYGGPYLAYGSASLSVESGGTTTSSTLKLKDVIGGVAGARIELPKRFVLGLELQASGETSFGAALSYVF